MPTAKPMPQQTPQKDTHKSFAKALLRPACVIAMTATIISGLPGNAATAHDTNSTSRSLPDVNALPPAPGLIFDIQAGEYIMFDELVERLSGRKYVLIGEKHDNPIHHHHQAQLVDALSKQDKTHRAVVWEMFTRDQQPLLDQTWQSVSISELGPALNWEERGWPSWHDYAPIAQAARDNDLKMVAGNLPDDILKTMISDGNKAMSDDLASKLDLPDVPQDFLTRLNVEIAEGHCNMLPDNMLGAFSNVQFARDASLARAMHDAALRDDIDGAFLIAGAMHVRNSIAVPWHLHRFEPGLAEKDVAVVSLIEADDPGDDASLIEDYAMRFGAPDDIDFMWFTNDIERDNPCHDLTMGQ